METITLKLLCRSGTHESLLKEGGIYARMVERQRLVSSDESFDNREEAPALEPKKAIQEAASVSEHITTGKVAAEVFNLTFILR